jgi:hypothetical protein
MSDDEAGIDPLVDLEARRREERRSVEEAGGGESEGFEMAEQELIDHATHTDQHTTARIGRDASAMEEERSDAVYGEPDEEQHTD